MKSLPEDISILYNLQMLDISNCTEINQLPRQIKYMTSLRHLYTHGCLNLKSMPPELGKLTKLQTLTCFVAAVTGPDCSDVEELEHLNLGGQLELCQVENVREAEAKLANLGNKKDLRELALRWTSVCNSEVLTNFEPHEGLQVLKIYSYGGKCMGILQNMVEIHLFHCERLQYLFRCGTSFTFPKLKQLTLKHLLDFERWFEINERQEEQIIFPLLEKLFIRHCGKLIALAEATLLQEPCIKVLELEDLKSFQRWNTAVERTQGVEIVFPKLEKLSIQECPELIDLPEAPQLSILEIEDGKQEIFHWVDRYLSSLTKLILRLENTETTPGAECTIIVPVDSKEKWNQQSPLTVMELGCCNPLFGSGALEPWDYFLHLGQLEIDRCDVLVHWPEKVFESLVSLKILNITNCKNLTGYAMFEKLESMFGKQQQCTSELAQGSSSSEAIAPTAVPELSSSPMDHSCPCLEYLYLCGCDGLSEVLHLPTSLKTIFIMDCSSIQVLSCQLDGLHKPQVTASINAPEPSAAAATEHSLPPLLSWLVIGLRTDLKMYTTVAVYCRSLALYTSCSHLSENLYTGI